MSKMTLSEIETFLAAPRHAVVATNTVDGPPQISPVWYIYEDGKLYISVGTKTAKYFNLKRDPRISVCIDGGHPDYRTVTCYGTATLIPPGDSFQEAMRWRIVRRYYETEADARRYYDSVRDQPSVLIVVTPEKIITQDLN
ncbi:MAG: PPOX class F420-dependent oxidoreductase [Anaerolineae bacterium]